MIYSFNLEVFFGDSQYLPVIKSLRNPYAIYHLKREQVSAPCRWWSAERSRRPNHRYDLVHLAARAFSGGWSVPRVGTRLRLVSRHLQIETIWDKSWTSWLWRWLLAHSNHLDTIDQHHNGRPDGKYRSHGGITGAILRSTWWESVSPFWFSWRRCNDKANFQILHLKINLKMHPK